MCRDASTALGESPLLLGVRVIKALILRQILVVKLFFRESLFMLPKPLDI